MTTPNVATVTEHFTVPFLVLPAGQHLEVKNQSTSANDAYFYVSGLLTTNYNYLPRLAK